MDLGSGIFSKPRLKKRQECFANLRAIDSVKRPQPSKDIRKLMAEVREGH